jgi:hypothetical protein
MNRGNARNKSKRGGAEHDSAPHERLRLSPLQEKLALQEGRLNGRILRGFSPFMSISTRHLRYLSSESLDVCVMRL